MADYKDIITGTLSNILGKAKDAVETVSQNVDVKGVYEQGASKAKSYGRIAKLSLELNGEQEELKRVYAEIGRLCYEQNKDNPADIYAPLFSQADAISGRIAASEQEIAELKAAAAPTDTSESDIEVEIHDCDFEEVVNSTEADGAAEAAEAPEAPADSENE